MYKYCLVIILHVDDIVHDIAHDIAHDIVHDIVHNIPVCVGHESSTTHVKLY